jgi:hypothetical protein
MYRLSILNNITTINSSSHVSGNTTLNNVTCATSLNVSGNTTLNNITTINSSLNVSGNTILNNASTINSTLNVLGQLTIAIATSSGNNPLYISSTNTGANNCINIKNNSTFNAYIGVGGTTMGGNYANNLF